MPEHMKFVNIFSVFSKRDKAIGSSSRPLTPEFRYRVVQFCNDTFSGSKDILGTPTVTSFWSNIHKDLQYLIGRRVLSKPKAPQHYDTLGFLEQCSDEHFLDFVELFCKSTLLWRRPPGDDGQELIRIINTFLDQDDLPYQLTNFNFFITAYGNIETQPRTSIPMIETYPQIIRRDSEVLHATIIQPTLILLQRSEFASASKEFLGALTDFRKGNHDDCVSKCGSSFESVMKIICDLKKWPYAQQDTASKLLKTILPRTQLEPFFEQPIMLIATIRNRLSSAHGAGTVPRTTPRHVAQYAINATGSAILLLVNETIP